MSFEYEQCQYPLRFLLQNLAGILLQGKPCLSLDLILVVLIYVKGVPIPGCPDNGRWETRFLCVI